MKIVYDKQTHKILGVQAIGHGIVVQRANYYATAMTLDATIDDMSFVDLCYSPPYSGVWDTSLILSNTIK
ncbi:MAG: CoA-disulfide reductase, partial [Bacilli bacterium]